MDVRTTVPAHARIIPVDNLLAPLPLALAMWPTTRSRPLSLSTHIRHVAHISHIARYNHSTTVDWAHHATSCYR